MARKILLLLAICIISQQSIAQKSPASTINNYRGALLSFFQFATGDDNDILHTNVYSCFYGYTRQKQNVTEILAVHCDLDSFETAMNSYQVKPDSISIRDYLNLIFTIKEKNNVVFTDLKYSVVDTMHINKDTLVLKLKKTIKLKRNGKDIAFATHEKCVMLFNPKYEEWLIRRIYFIEDTELDDETTTITVYKEAHTTQLPYEDSTIIVKGVPFKMIFVSGGVFTLGCDESQGGDCFDNEKPPKQYKVNDYHIGETEVTQELWVAVMGPSTNHSDRNNPKNPVNNISYDEITLFLTKLNSITNLTFRLPTELEWEYAARGGNKSQHYKYSGGNNLKKIGRGGGESIDACSYNVKTREPNELGIYDMSGNVWEWCGTLFAKYNRYDKKQSGLMSVPPRVIRGGCSSSPAEECRVATRKSMESSKRDKTVGFRLAIQ